MNTVLKKVLGKTEPYEDLDRTSKNPTFKSPAPAMIGEPRSDGKISVDDAITYLGFGPFQIKMTIFMGFFWMTDAMEIMMLSIIGPTLVCSWKLTAWQQALLTSVVFGGMTISSGPWGILADKFGRRTQLFLCSTFIFYYGLLSSVSPNFICLLILRGLVGVGIGGVAQSVTLYSEFLPTSSRGKCIILMEVFWAIGTFMVVLLSLFVIPYLGWRYLLAIISIPAFLFMPIVAWLPESPRYDMASGKDELAMKTLQRIARKNGRAPIKQTLAWTDNSRRERGRIADLWVVNYRITTALLWLIWMLNSFCYYGIVLMTTELFQLNDACHGGDPNLARKDADCYLTCRDLSTKDYMDILLTTIAEFPGLLMTAFLIEIIGRKLTISLFYLIYAIFICLVNMCASRTALTIFLFVGRASITSAFQASFVYTPEVYPTPIRALGMGMCNSISRIGAIITPFFAQVLLRHNLYLAINIYAILGLIGSLAAFLLPVETKGRNMTENNTDNADDNSSSSTFD